MPRKNVNVSDLALAVEWLRSFETSEEFQEDEQACERVAKFLEKEIEKREKRKL